MNIKDKSKSILYIFIIILLVSAYGWLSFLQSKNQVNQRVYFWNDSVQKLELLESDEILTTKFAADIFEQSADLDTDLAIENYQLVNKQLTISESQKIIWQSPIDWQVDSFFLADANNDGLVDINLSVWKAGDFGTSQPFWVKENDMSVKNHFFIFNLVDDQAKALWQSSNLEKPNCEFMLADIDNDQENDLIVIEGEYLDDTSCQGKYLAIWKWNDWGFTNQWRSLEDDFTNLQIKGNNKQNYVVVDSESF